MVALHTTELSAHYMQQATQAVKLAIENKHGLRVCAGKSKINKELPVKTHLQELNFSGCSGIIAYEPSELYLTARSGTPMKEICNLLAEHKQQLAFDPPDLDKSTLGGVLTTGISCSARPYIGNVRNALLGARVVNGLGNSLKFGGTVIKNVAGFDIARLLVGSYGTLAAVIEATVRITAKPKSELTLFFPSTIEHALQKMIEVDSKTYPVSAQCWYRGNHAVRLSGSDADVTHAAEQLKGKEKRNEKIWQRIARSSLPEMKKEADFILLRVLCNKNHAITSLGGEQPFLLDWGGQLRWYRMEKNTYVQLLQNDTLRQAGRVWRIISPYMLINNATPISRITGNLHNNIRQAFDPHGVFNPDIQWHQHK